MVTRVGSKATRSLEAMKDAMADLADGETVVVRYFNIQTRTTSS